ncbi:MAG: helix-turn-helix domain-containing protein [Desulfovibrionales bacterium]
MKPFFKNLLPFSAYILWLLAFPMQGVLLQKTAISHPLPIFLIPHILSLFLIGLSHNRLNIVRISFVALPLISLLTLWTLLAEAWAEFALIGTALLSPFFLIRAGIGLKSFQNTTLITGLALALGNFLLVVLIEAPVPAMTGIVLVSLLPLTALHANFQVTDLHQGDPFYRYLPFVLVFYFVGGLMYGFLVPRYAETAWIHESELFFYMLAVLTVWPLSRREPELLLALAILCGMGAVSLFAGTSPGMINLSMYLMQASFGFSDLFLILLMITSAQPVRTLGLGTAAMCLGILGGETLVRFAGVYLEPAVVGGNIVLTIAVLSLYVIGKMKNPPMASEDRSEVGGAPDGTIESVCMDLPPWIASRLSLQERTALELVIKGKVFREVALEMGISESTVKTYMRRVYEKLEVSGKEAVIRKMNGILEKEDLLVQ